MVAIDENLRTNSRRKYAADRAAFGGDQIPQYRHYARATIPICGSIPHRDFALLGSTGRLRFDTSPTGTRPLVNNLYHGTTLDAATGLYYERFRNYSPSLGTPLRQEPKSLHTAGAMPRVIQRDPIGYAGGINLYVYVGSNPVSAANTEGTAVPSMPPQKGKLWRGGCAQNSVIVADGYVPKYQRDAQVTICETCVMCDKYSNCQQGVDAMILGTAIGKGIVKGVK